MNDFDWLIVKLRKSLGGGHSKFDNQPIRIIYVMFFFSFSGENFNVLKYCKNEFLNLIYFRVNLRHGRDENSNTFKNIFDVSPTLFTKALISPQGTFKHQPVNFMNE